MLLRLTPQCLARVCAYLEAEDIASLARTSRNLNHCLCKEDEAIWKLKTLDLDAPRLTLRNIFYALPIPLKKPADSETDNSNETWKNRYLTRRANFKRSFELWSGDAEDHDEEQREKRRSIDREFVVLKDELSAAREEDDEEKLLKILASVSEKCLKIIDNLPTHPGCFHLLSLICFMMNRFADNLRILEIGKEMNPGYEPFDDLEKEARLLLEQIEGSTDEEPLLSAPDTISAALSDALTIVFARFDRNDDGHLSLEEFDVFLRLTNDSTATRDMFDGMCRSFNTTTPRVGRGLSFAGFCRFYMIQSLEDPQETRSDLAQLGFDPKTLVQTQIPKPA